MGFALGVLCILFGAFIDVFNPAGWRTSIVPIGLGIFWFIYLPIIYLFRSYNAVKRSPSLQGIVRCQFDENGYTVEALHSQAQVKFEALLKWKEGKRTFLLYPQPRIGTVVPKRFFQNAADVNTLRGLLQTRVAKR